MPSLWICYFCFSYHLPSHICTVIRNEVGTVLRYLWHGEGEAWSNTQRGLRAPHWPPGPDTRTWHPISEGAALEPGLHLCVFLLKKKWTVLHTPQSLKNNIVNAHVPPSKWQNAVCFLSLANYFWVSGSVSCSPCSAEWMLYNAPVSSEEGLSLLLSRWRCPPKSLCWLARMPQLSMTSWPSPRTSRMTLSKWASCDPHATVGWRKRLPCKSIFNLDFLKINFLLIK